MCVALVTIVRVGGQAKVNPVSMGVGAEGRADGRTDGRAGEAKHIIILLLATGKGAASSHLAVTSELPDESGTHMYVFNHIARILYVYYTLSLSLHNLIRSLAIFRDKSP